MFKIKCVFLLLILMNISFANKEFNMKETAYIAGGCYWGLEELIRKIPGVESTQVGFSGGSIKNVSYNDVTRGDTGHAETLKVEFNSDTLTFKDLLLHFFKMHNPTTINQQGNDIGTQYRSAIFYIDSHQKEIALETISIVDNSKNWEKPVITEVKQFDTFYAAEESHQKYLLKNPKGYSCHFVRDFKFD